MSSLHSKIFQQLNFEILMLLVWTSESFSASSDGRENTPAACRTFFVPCFASWALLNGWEGCRTARKHLRSEVRVGRGVGRSFRVVVHPHWCTPTTGLHAAASLSTGDPTTLLCSSFLMFQRWERERRCSEGEDLAWSLKLSAASRKQSENLSLPWRSWRTEAPDQLVSRNPPLSHLSLHGNLLALLLEARHSCCSAPPPALLPPSTPLFHRLQHLSSVQLEPRTLKDHEEKKFHWSGLQIKR